MKRRAFTVRGNGSGSDGTNKSPPRNVENAEGAVSPPDRLPWLRTLAVLSVVYITNQWCRSLIFYLVSFAPDSSAHSFMNVALNFDQTQYGVLASFAFTSLFAISALVAGRFSDHCDRSKLTATACLIWGLATVATGFAPNFTSVFALRVIQGISMGFTTPAGFGILADAFPERHRATANSLYGSGVYFGGGLASLSALLTAHPMLGWRGTCVCVGGVALAASALTRAFVRDPREHGGTASSRPRDHKSATERHQRSRERGVNEEQQQQKQQGGEEDDESLLAVLGSILRPLPIRLLFAASALRFCAGFSIGIWLPPLLRQAFPERHASFAYVNAAIVSAGGFVSSVVGGRLADWTSTKAPNIKLAGGAGGGSMESAGGHKGAGRAWVVAGSCFAAAPAWLKVVEACTLRTKLLSATTATTATTTAASVAASTAALGAGSGAGFWFRVSGAARAVAGVGVGSDMRAAIAFEAAMVWLLVEYLVAEMWFGPTVSILQSLVPPRRRGTAQGLFSILTTFGNLAPAAIGVAVSAQVPLPLALAATVPTFYILSGILFSATALSLRNN